MPDAVPLLSVHELKSLGTAGGRPFTSVLVVKKLTAKTAANGNPFLSLDLGDRTGSFGCTIFNDNPLFDLLKNAGEGAVVRVEGKTDHFQGRLLPRLPETPPLTEDEFDAPRLLGKLVEPSPENADALWTELNGFIDSIGHAGLRATVRTVFDEIGEDFRSSPAAVVMHHAYRHGLLEHTVHMARVAHALLPLYTEVDADLALAGVLLHDAGKTI